MSSLLSFPNQLNLYCGIAVCWIVILCVAGYVFRRARDAFPATGSTRLLFLLSLAAALLQCFSTAHEAADLSISDSVEYAVGADRIYHFGTYDLSIEGRSLPPRYQPFFSLLFGAPAHAIFHAGLGSPIYIVLPFAMLGFLAAWLAAFRAGGAWGAISVTALLLVLPDFRSLTQVILSDGPIVSAALLLLLLFLSIRRENAKPADFLAAGALIGFAILLRSVNFLFLLPFLFLLKGSSVAETCKRLVALLLPVAAAGAALLVANKLVFLSPFRTGYHFWLSVPTDFPELLFSFRYVSKSLAALFENSGALLLILVVAARSVIMKIVSKRTGRPITSAPHVSQGILFCCLTGLGICVVFLPYFWTDFRFFAPLVACLAVPAGIIFGEVWAAFGVRPIVGYLVLGLLALHGAFKIVSPPPFVRIATAERIAASAPDNAIIISGLDPVYLEPLVLRGTHRSTIPVSRSVEFASKICRLSPPGSEVHPRSALDHRAAGLEGPGSINPVEHTAIEEPEYISQLVVSNERPVVLDTTFIKPNLVGEFERRYTLGPIGERLFILKIGQHS